MLLSQITTVLHYKHLDPKIICVIKWVPWIYFSSRYTLRKYATQPDYNGFPLQTSRYKDHLCYKMGSMDLFFQSLYIKKTCHSARLFHL